MNKKFRAFLVCLSVVLAFSGCGKKEEKTEDIPEENKSEVVTEENSEKVSVETPVEEVKSEKEICTELYQQSFEKNKTLQDYTSVSQLELKMNLAGLSVETVTDMKGVVSDFGENAFYSVDVEAMGEKQHSSMYKQGDWVYIPKSDDLQLDLNSDLSAISEDKVTKIPSDKAFNRLLNLTEGGLAEVYINGLEKANTFSFSEDATGMRHISFVYPEKHLLEISTYITDILQETMLNGFEEQAYQQFKGFNLSEQELRQTVNQMLDVYKVVFSHAKIKDVQINAAVDSEGYLESQNISMIISLDLSNLFKVLGQELDENTAKTVQAVEINLNSFSQFIR